MTGRLVAWAPMAPDPSGTTASDASTLPGVSVILPVRNEEQHLRAAVGRVLDQRYAGPYEVVIAVGPSHDRTREIAADLAASDPRVTVVENPTGRTPAGLNLAVATARHDVLVRVDGHSEIGDEYVLQAVLALNETGAANVGGMMIPVGRAPFQQAVARAMSSPLGIGSAAFHTGGAAGPAPTVYLGVFRRSALEKVGGFDETFVRAQDWELNHRLRKAGEIVWFDPSLVVTYRPRSTWAGLVRQFFRTGQWRRQVVRVYPETAGLRYLAPPLALLGVILGTVAAVVGVVTGPRWLVLGAALPVMYLLLVVVGGALVGRRLTAAAWCWMPPVIATMHLAWGAGFLRGVAGDDARVAAERHYPVDAHKRDEPLRHAGSPAPERPTTED